MFLCLIDHISKVWVSKVLNCWLHSVPLCVPPPGGETQGKCVFGDFGHPKLAPSVDSSPGLTCIIRKPWSCFTPPALKAPGGRNGYFQGEIAFINRHRVQNRTPPLRGGCLVQVRHAFANTSTSWTRCFHSPHVSEVSSVKAPKKKTLSKNNFACLAHCSNRSFALFLHN